MALSKNKFYQTNPCSARRSGRFSKHGSGTPCTKSNWLNYLVLLAAALLAIGPLPVAADEPIKIGHRKQLFVDDFIVARREGVSRELGKVVKVNDGRPIMEPDKPWEDDAFGFLTVIDEGKKFRMWYRPWSEASLAYAESEDGLHWDKPNLGLVHFNTDEAVKLGLQQTKPVKYSGKDNNLLKLMGQGFSCFLDTHETDPEHRYKAAYGPLGSDKAAIAHSADGLHWVPYNEGNPVTGRACDTSNQLLWDEDAKTYRLLTRTDFGEGGGAGELRGTRMMTNPDVKKNPTDWKTVRSWKFDREGPDEAKRRQIYCTNDWIYAGVHFGLMLVYEWVDDTSEGPADLVKRHERDICNFYIATSRDANNWDLTWVYAGQPMIPRGPDGSFDKDMLMSASGIITRGDEHWLYYGGYRERHGFRPRNPGVGLAKLRLDGFVALTAGDEGGTVLTKPFVFEGKRLQINLDAKDGEAWVAVLDGAGIPIKGFDAKPLRQVDGVRLEPQWETDPAALKGRVVRLQFRLRKARLYAFQVTG